MQRQGNKKESILFYKFCSRSMLSSASRALNFDLLDKDEKKVVLSLSEVLELNITRACGFEYLNA